MTSTFKELKGRSIDDFGFASVGPWAAKGEARGSGSTDSCRTGLLTKTRDRPGPQALHREGREALEARRDERSRKIFQENGRSDPAKPGAEQWARRLARKVARRRRQGDGEGSTWKAVNLREGVERFRKNPAVDFAIQPPRVSSTDILGDAKAGASSHKASRIRRRKPFDYKDGVFLRTRPWCDGRPLNPGWLVPRSPPGGAPMMRFGPQSILLGGGLVDSSRRESDAATRRPTPKTPNEADPRRRPSPTGTPQTQGRDGAMPPSSARPTRCPTTRPRAPDGTRKAAGYYQQALGCILCG